MENCKCVDLGIPVHLHKADRKTDNIFENTEEVYRRFPSFDSNNKSTILEDSKLSASVFSTKRMSFNRSKYCKDCSDVLYNSENNAHFNNYGIASISVENINKFSKVHPVSQDKNYTLKLIHDPIECMYPHTELFIDLSGELLEDLDKPATIKTAIKVYYRDCALIVKSPI